MFLSVHLEMHMRYMFVCFYVGDGGEVLAQW